MSEAKSGRILFSLFKVAVFLGIGSMIGFFLGLAYASHLFGTTPVVNQIQNWLAGDSLYEGPLPVDQAGNLMNTPVAIIPKMGACIGFGMALSVYSGAFIMRMFVSLLSKNKNTPNS